MNDTSSRTASLGDLLKTKIAANRMRKLDATPMRKAEPQDASQIDILRAQMRFGLPVGVGTPMKIVQRDGQPLTKLGPPAATAGRAGYVRDPEPNAKPHPADVSTPNRYYEGNLRSLVVEDIFAADLRARQQAQERLLQQIRNVPRMSIPITWNVPR